MPALPQPRHAQEDIQFCRARHLKRRQRHRRRQLQFVFVGQLFKLFGLSLTTFTHA
jgi:hypothetical protein